MALDEHKKDDQNFDIDGFQYLVNKGLMDRLKNIKLDFIGVGFKINSEVKVNAASSCGSCSTTGSCCS